MADIGNEVILTSHKRNYIQYGGAAPGNSLKYAGQNAQYMSITGVGTSENGGVDPVYVPHPNMPGKYKMVGKKIGPQALAKATLSILERKGAIPKQLQKIGCEFNLYELTGACSDLSDTVKGWSDYVLVYAGATVSDKDYGDRSNWDSSNPIEDRLALTLREIYPVGPLSFGEQASTLIDREVIDVVYGKKYQCSDCGNPTDGTDRIYAVTKSSGAGSPGLPAEVVYSLNGGQTWTEINITGISGTADPSAIDIASNYLIVLSPAEDAYYYAELNINGVPGTWTKITSGFVAAGSPNDMYVASAREVWFCGDGGYIYLSTDITTGVTVVNAGTATSSDLGRVHGVNETIVAVGDAGAVVRSINRGSTWAVTTTSPANAVMQAVAVLSSNLYWVGSAAGNMYYTKDGGLTWATKTFAGSGAGQVRDIIFPTPECGFMAHDTATPTARLFTTYDGGDSWSQGESRIISWPVFDVARRIACPSVDATIDVNNVAIAGLAGDGTDGILLVGVAGRL